MSEEIFRELRSVDGEHRALVIRRTDGCFTYRHQRRSAIDWGPLSVDAGVYDSADTAEAEARQRLPWLRDLFH